MFNVSVVKQHFSTILFDYYSFKTFNADFIQKSNVFTYVLEVLMKNIFTIYIINNSSSINMMLALLTINRAISHTQRGLESCNVFSSNLFSSNLFSSNLFSSNLFSSHLFSSHLFSSHLFNSHLFNSHLFSSHLFSSNLFSSHLIRLNN